MKIPVSSLFLVATLFTCSPLSAQNSDSTNLYIDVHHLGHGHVTDAAVAAAHKKDLAVEKKYGVDFINYWVDTTRGDIYCLSRAGSPQAIIATHREAHGLLPAEIYKVTSGTASKMIGGEPLFLDVHEFGPGNVTAAAVANAHNKDLATEKKYGVNFINYWVNEKQGVVMCLSEAPDSNAVIKTHLEAHGLLPVYVSEVQQGQ